MKISELSPQQGRVFVEGVIIKKGSIRSIDSEKFKGKVCDAVLEDDSGEIILTLWGEDCRFKVGDKVRILNGYVNEFQGEKKLNSGKFGSIEKVI